MFRCKNNEIEVLLAPNAAWQHASKVGGSFFLPPHVGTDLVLAGREKLGGEEPRSRVLGAAGVLRSSNPWVMDRNSESLPRCCQSTFDLINPKEK